MDNYYQNPDTTVCEHCSIHLSNCADCFYNNSYDSSDAADGAIQFGCFECEDGYFLDNLTCTGLVTCSGATVVNS